MKRYLIEFIGTFFLTFIITFTGNPLAIAGMLIAMIYMGGYISGAHYNPAITLGVLIRGSMGWRDAVMYWVVQVLGALCAAGFYTYATGKYFVPAPSELASFQTAAMMEFFIAFALVTVVLHVATSSETSGNSYFGLAIGLVILAGVFAGGLSGGVYNPAVAIGSYLVDSSRFSAHVTNLLIYLIGPLSGGVMAALVYRINEAPSGRSDERKKLRK